MGRALSSEGGLSPGPLAPDLAAGTKAVSHQPVGRSRTQITVLQYVPIACQSMVYQFGLTRGSQIAPLVASLPVAVTSQCFDHRSRQSLQ